MIVTLTTAELKALVRDAVAETLRELPKAQAERWVTVARAAEIYACTPQTIRNMITRDGAPARRLGKDFRVNLEQFGDWLDARSDR